MQNNSKYSNQNLSADVNRIPRCNTELIKNFIFLVVPSFQTAMVDVSNEYPKHLSNNNHDESVTQLHNAVQSDRSK